MAKKYDVLVVGGGHNGLVTAAYLARAGRKVLLLERRELVGGACVTEETWPGYRVSTAAYVNSLFRPEIIRDLDLHRHGFAMLPRDPASFTPFPDGRYLLMGPQPGLNQQEIAKFSPRDAEAFPKYERMLETAAAFLEPLLTETPPDPWSLAPSNLWTLAKLGWRLRKLGRALGGDVVEILTAPARTILDRWFESDELKATLATDAIIGAFASPSTPGTAYVLFHHVMGECNGVRGVWGYVRGGMGGLTQALASACQALGAEIRCGAAVNRITTANGRVTGVVLTSGEEITATCVASNADAHVTFLKLVGEAALPPEFTAAVRRLDYSSASMKINLALAELPRFSCLSEERGQHRGTIHICPTQDYIERAFDDAKYGRPSASPVLECTIPSVVDDTVAPPGRHVMSMFVQYAPANLLGTTWEQERERFADRCLEILAEYAPNVRGAVLHREVLAPPDLEAKFGLTGGNIFQGAMTLGSLFSFRPVAGWAGYRTPIAGLYLCGAAAHPGGGVMGACGRNAARVILQT